MISLHFRMQMHESEDYEKVKKAREDGNAGVDMKLTVRRPPPRAARPRARRAACRTPPAPHVVVLPHLIFSVSPWRFSSPPRLRCFAPTPPPPPPGLASHRLARLLVCIASLPRLWPPLILAPLYLAFSTSPLVYCVVSAFRRLLAPSPPHLRIASPLCPL